MDLSFIQEFIRAYGYVALFVGTFCEGETFFILGGVAARKEILNPYYVALAAMLGGFLGDQFFFFLGHWRGNRLLGMSRRLAAKAKEAQRLVRRHDVTLMLMSRFLYGLRIVVPVACGTAGIRPWRFMLLNFISALLWTVTFGSLGYWAGGWMFERLGLLRNLQILALVLVAALAASVLAGRFIKRRLMADSDNGL